MTYPINTSDQLGKDFKMPRGGRGRSGGGGGFGGFGRRSAPASPSRIVFIVNFLLSGIYLLLIKMCFVKICQLHEFVSGKFSVDTPIESIISLKRMFLHNVYF